MMEVRPSAQYPAGSILRQARHLARVSGPLWVLSLMADRLLPFGVLGWWPDVTVSSAALRRQLQALFGAWGMSAEHTSITVDHILYADLRGIDSHGCSMLAHYRRLLAAGAVTMKPAIHVVRDSPTTALLDGGGGLGHVAADMAMKLAIEKCRATGMGAVAVRCACGRTLQLLCELEGRVEDVLALPGGRFVHPRAIWQVFKKSPEVLQYRLVQRAPQRFELKLVTVDDANFQRAMARRVPELQAVLGAAATIDAERCTEIPRRSGEKLRAVESYVGTSRHANVDS